jgi:hypothetical protein
MRLSILVAGLVLGFGLGCHDYIYDGELPETTSYEIDMDEIRRLAAAPPSDLPLHVTVSKISDNTFPVVVLALRVVVSHDGAQIERYTADGWIKPLLDAREETERGE